MDKPTLRSRTEVLELLTDDDIAALRARWHLPNGKARWRDDPEFLAAVGQKSMTTLILDCLAVGSETITMLNEVVEFLVANFTTLRTTGGVLVLDEDFGLPPQEIEAALKWSSRSLRRLDTSTWQQLRQEFESDVAPFMKRLVTAAEVTILTRWEPMSLLEAMRRKPFETQRAREMGESLPSKRVRTARWNAEAVTLCQTYSAQLARVVKRLAAIPESQASADLTSLVSLLRSTLTELWTAENPRARSASADKRVAARIPYVVEREDREHWRLFQENVLFLADAEESRDPGDVLRLDLFRKRPQLYEVWCLATVLGFFRKSGYRTELKSAATNALGRAVWTLNYAKSRSPIAQITNTRSGEVHWLFYQLFRHGVERNEMPDIALLPTADPESRPIWIMDPKHSERRGYSAADYRDVALRYHTAFHPGATWIVEYFPREDIGDMATVPITENVDLFLAVSPSGNGLAALTARLRQFHPKCTLTMAIVDVSSSFAHAMPRVLASLQSLFDSGSLLSDDTMLFAADAHLVSTSTFLGGAVAPDLTADGTVFRPALRLLADLDARGIGPSVVMLYTDGRFSDMTLSEATESLRGRGELIVAETPSTA